MKKIITVILILSIYISFSIFAANNAQNYDTISLYLHSTIGVDAITNSLTIPKKSNSANREGVILKIGLDAYKNEDLGSKFGATAGLTLDVPFRSADAENGLSLGRKPYIGLSGGIIFRSRPWDYIDISLSTKGVISTYDYEAISLGLALEPSADLYFDDYIYLKISLLYSSEVVKFPFKGDYFIERKNLPSMFSVTVGAGYAFGGYSR